MTKKQIRVGVVGLGRGRGFARGATELVGMKLVALCDNFEPGLKREIQHLEDNDTKNVTAYTDYDKFLEHDMDAVVLANYFHEHAPFAVKALNAGFHVMSETASCENIADGVALARAVESSKKIYMLAENYPFSAYNQEMRRLYQNGEIGDFQYGEGEYVHAFSARKHSAISMGENHWRNWLPATYYNTHSTGPVMYITNSRPKKVGGFVIPYDKNDPETTLAAKVNDGASVLMMTMDNGAVVRSLQCILRGHGNFVRIHGNRGMMENLRHGNQSMLRIVKNPWDRKAGEPAEKIYTPEFPVHAEEAKQTGHGGGDFFCNYNFAQAIRSGEQPFFDVYKGLDMSLCAILGYRSALEDKIFTIPDLSDEKVRKQYEDDRWSANPALAHLPGQPAPSILGKIEKSAAAKKNYHAVWAEKEKQEQNT